MEQPTQASSSSDDDDEDLCGEEPFRTALQFNVINFSIYTCSIMAVSFPNPASTLIKDDLNITSGTWANVAACSTIGLAAGCVTQLRRAHLTTVCAASLCQGVRRTRSEAGERS